MGYIPVVLALLGFIVLWGIVNYHSIKTRRKEAQELASLLFKQAAARQQVLKQLLQTPQDSPAQATLQSLQPLLAEQHRKDLSAREKIAAEQPLNDKIQTLLQQFADGSDSMAETPSYQALTTADTNYRRAVLTYRNRLRQYNDLVTKNPTRLVAAITGFQPADSL